MKWARLWRRLRGGRLTRARAAGSVAAGLFIGALPLFGLHFPLCVAVAVPLSLDLMIAYLAANISNPLFAPFLIAGEIQLGALLLEGHFIPFSVEQARATGVGGFVAQAAVGSVAMGGLLAAIGAGLTSLIVRRDAALPGPSIDDAVDKTLARYARAPRRDRFYVAAKLHSDPMFRQLAALEPPFGELLDVATGRAQLPLFLVESGKASGFTGLDWDERKVRVAADAAGECGRVRTEDVNTAELPTADTVLLIDVLHYLERDAQLGLLQRATSAVRTGGRLLVRELDPTRGLRSKLAIWAERRAIGTSMNRGTTLELIGTDELCEALSSLGFTSRVLPHPDGKLSPNYLVVAERSAE